MGGMKGKTMQKASKTANSAAYREGRRAADLGSWSDSSPYPAGSVQRRDWELGHADFCHEERLRVYAAASLLGRLGRGVPRNFSPDERERRRLQLAAVRVHRWPAKGARPCV